MGVRDFAFPLHTPETASAGGGMGSDFGIASALGSSFSRWITSHRDLPLRLNQYTLSFSRESSNAPFLRSCQYLVQEAYSAHLTQRYACEERDQVLDIYSALYRELLAVPVVKGYRGASSNGNRDIVTPATTETPTDETKISILLGYLPTLNQWIEAGTFRELGRTISREHDITVWAPPFLPAEETDDNPVHIWQNTWTLTTRSIGLIILTYADNRGLVLPPRVAPTQVLLIPQGARLTEEDRQILHDEINVIHATLVQRGVRAVADLRDDRSPAWKWNEGLVRGVPVLLGLRIEDVRDRVLTVYRRDIEKGKSGWKVCIEIKDLMIVIPRLLGEVQDELLRRAEERFSLDNRLVETWDNFIREFCGEYADRNGFGGCLVLHCLGEGCGKEIESLVAGARQEALDPLTPSVKYICIPWEQPKDTDGKACINPNCTKVAKKWAMFGCK